MLAAYPDRLAGPRVARPVPPLLWVSSPFSLCVVPRPNPYSPRCSAAWPSISLPPASSVLPAPSCPLSHTRHPSPKGLATRGSPAKYGGSSTACLTCLGLCPSCGLRRGPRRRLLWVRGTRRATVGAVTRKRRAEGSLRMRTAHLRHRARPVLPTRPTRARAGPLTFPRLVPVQVPVVPLAFRPRLLPLCTSPLAAPHPSLGGSPALLGRGLRPLPPSPPAVFRPLRPAWPGPARRPLISARFFASVCPLGWGVWAGLWPGGWECV